MFWLKILNEGLHDFLNINLCLNNKDQVGSLVKEGHGMSVWELLCAPPNWRRITTQGGIWLIVLRPGLCLLLLFSSGRVLTRVSPSPVRSIPLSSASCLHDTRRHCCVCVCVCVEGLCCSIFSWSGWAGIRLHVVLFMAAFSWVMESPRGFNVGDRNEPRWP